MTKKQALAVAELFDSDHCFLSRDVGEDIAHALGVKAPATQCQMVDPTAFKGLTVPGKRKGDMVFGYDSAYLASEIALALDPTFKNPMMGRGSSLRFATNFIQEYLKNQKQISLFRKHTKGV